VNSRTLRKKARNGEEARVRYAPAIAADLLCSGCRRPLVKDGKLKCTKCPCKCEVDATPGQEELTCPHCKGPQGKPRVLAVSDRALCPDRRCPNHQEGIGTPMFPQTQKQKEESLNGEARRIVGMVIVGIVTISALVLAGVMIAIGLSSFQETDNARSLGGPIAIAVLAVLVGLVGLVWLMWASITKSD